MIDMKSILENPEEILANLRKREPQISLDPLILLEKERKRLQTEYDQLRRDIHEASNYISKLDKTSVEFLQQRESSRAFGGRVADLKKSLEETSSRLEKELLAIPNVILPQVPVSQSKEDKEIIYVYGEKPTFDFKPLDHLTISERLGIIDFKRGTKIAGSGFPLYRGKGAILEWSLINFMIDNARENGYEFMLMPLLNNATSLTATGSLPKFADELYVFEKDGLYLIPTAETPLTNLFRGEVLEEAQLPARFASYSPCFRREAGAAGKMTKGLMRLHQFNKLETYTFCLPEQVTEEHKRLVSNGEQILKKLGLHFRLANLPSCDLAQQSAQTFDIEAWLPVLGEYSEVSSASNCLDYQARRADIRYKGENKKGYVYTLNCSALATPRVMISLLESNQTEDGHVVIPEALRRYTQFDKI
jgi:seryl-tRNA synthetase